MDEQHLVRQDDDPVIELHEDSSPPPPKPRRRKAVIMSAVVIGSGLVAASVTMGPTALRMYSQKDATLSSPTQAAGFVLDESAQAKTAAEDLRSVVAARFNMDKTIGAIYNDPAAPTRTILLVGGTAFLGKPTDELDQIFKLLDDTAGGVAGIHEVDAGSLGGIMKCGSADSADGKMSVCGWADHGSLVLGLFPDRNEPDSAKALRDLRGAIQHRT